MSQNPLIGPHMSQNPLRDSAIMVHQADTLVRIIFHQLDTPMCIVTITHVVVITRELVIVIYILSITATAIPILMYRQS